MIQYNTIQQVQFFSSCDTATSLLETRNQLEYMQNVVVLRWFATICK
ncbi:hypothetical protein [Flavobacterium sp.]